MFKKNYVIKLDNAHTKYRTVIFSDDCFIENIEDYKKGQEQLLKLLQDPEFNKCGLEPFQTLKMYHNGFKWVAEIEAVLSS